MDKIEIVKLAQLDLLSELKRICDKNGISYFLVGGTLIGAIRHNGFIPWDDDIDVGMLRADYDKFIKACASELDNDYELYDWHKDVLSPIPFIKLKIKGTHYKEGLSKNTGVDDGIFIDVFPFDNAPDSKSRRYIQNVKNIVIKKVLLLKLGYSIDENASGIKRVVYWFLNIISNIKSIDGWKDAYESNCLCYNNQLTEYVISLGGSYSYMKELKSRKDLEELVLHKFEDDDYYVPSCYDSFLRHVYGDYMKLPPQSERTSRHQILQIDLGNYRIKKWRKDKCQT